MFTRKFTSLLHCAGYFVFVSHFILNTRAQIENLAGASLSSAPVAFYSRRNAFGDVQNAASFGNAPIGLYGKTHYPTLPVQYNFPLFYGPFSPYFFPPFFGLPNFGLERPPFPTRPQFPIRPPVPAPRPPPSGVRPVVPTMRPPTRPVRPPRPVSPGRPTPKPGVNPRLLGGLFGGGLIPDLGNIFG